jgi:hypothetical protein
MCPHNTQALGLENLELPLVASDIVRPNWANLIQYGTYELLVQYQSVTGGQTDPLIQKRSEFHLSLGCFSSNLSHMTSIEKSLPMVTPK